MKTGKAIGTDKEIVVPELEAHAKTYKPRNRPWSQREIAIVKKYYGRVPIAELLKHLDDRTINALDGMWKRLKQGGETQ